MPLNHLHNLSPKWRRRRLLYVVVVVVVVVVAAVVVVVVGVKEVSEVMAAVVEVTG